MCIRDRADTLFSGMGSLRTGLEIEDTSRTNFGGLGLEDAVFQHIPGYFYVFLKQKR